MMDGKQLAIIVAVFFGGIGIGYVAFTASYDSDNMMHQNRMMYDEMIGHPEMMRSMMQDPRMVDPVVNYIRTNPHLIDEMMKDEEFEEMMIQSIMQDSHRMQGWMNTPDHADQMVTMMSQDHEFLMHVLPSMLEDPMLRLQIIGHIAENPEAMKQIQDMMDSGKHETEMQH